MLLLCCEFGCLPMMRSVSLAVNAFHVLCCARVAMCPPQSAAERSALVACKVIAWPQGTVPPAAIRTCLQRCATVLPSERVAVALSSAFVELTAVPANRACCGKQSVELLADFLQLHPHSVHVVTAVVTGSSFLMAGSSPDEIKMAIVDTGIIVALFELVDVFRDSAISCDNFISLLWNASCLGDAKCELLCSLDAFAVTVSLLQQHPDSKEVHEAALGLFLSAARHPPSRELMQLCNATAYAQRALLRFPESDDVQEAGQGVIEIMALVRGPRARPACCARLVVW